VLPILVFIVAVSGYHSHRHHYGSNRLIDHNAAAVARTSSYYDDYHDYYAPYIQRPAYGRHRRVSHPDAQALSDKLLVLEQELRALRRARAHRAYDDIYDDDDDDDEAEMSGTASDLIVANNVVSAGVTKYLFRANDATKMLEVKWPDAGSYKLLKWEDYLKEVDAGSLSTEQEQSVYGAKGLRLLTVEELLAESCTEAGLESYTKDCFVNLGSDTAKSDLDFTYIRWDEPTKVVKSLVEYYNLFHSIYNGWPLEVFDMNFYIANGFIKNKPDGKCWSSLAKDDHTNDVMIALFTEIYNKEGEAWYELASPKAYNDQRYKVYDRYMAYLLISRRFTEGFDEKLDTDDDDFAKLLQAGTATPDVKIVHLLQYAHVFYLHLEQIRVGKGIFASWKTPDNRLTDKSFDRTKIFLKTLLYLMNYWSDESYVSNEALQLIFNKGVEDVKDDERIYLAVLDNLAFVEKYYHEHPKDLLTFWDRASKYIHRVCVLLNLADDFKLWPSKPAVVEHTKESRVYGDLYTKLKKDETDNLAHLAEVWQQKWDKTGGNEKGAKKIRGDIPFVYLLNAEKEIDEKHKTEWMKATLPKARKVWVKVKKRFKDADALYGWMNKLRRHLDRDYFFVPMRIGVTKSDLKHYLKKVYNRVQTNVRVFVGDSIKIVPGETGSDTSFENPAKKIIYNVITDDELEKTVPNAFNVKEIYDALEHKDVKLG